MGTSDLHFWQAATSGGRRRARLGDRQKTQGELPQEAHPACPETAVAPATSPARPMPSLRRPPSSCPANRLDAVPEGLDRTLEAATKGRLIGCVCMAFFPARYGTPMGEVSELPLRVMIAGYTFDKRPLAFRDGLVSHHWLSGNNNSNTTPCGPRLRNHQSGFFAQAGAAAAARRPGSSHCLDCLVRMSNRNSDSGKSETREEPSR